MKKSPQLEFLLEGIKDSSRRETIIAAYHSLCGDDPESFPSQFAVLGAAVAARIEAAAAKAQNVFEHAERLEFNPDEIAKKIASEIPSFRELATVRDELKTAVANIPRTAPQAAPQQGGGLVAVAVILGVLNLALLLYHIFAPKLF